MTTRNQPHGTGAAEPQVMALWKAVLRKRIFLATTGIPFLLLAPAELVTAATTITTTSSFDYDLATGLLRKSVTEPGDANLCIVREYTLDGYGHTKTISERNCNGSAPVAAGAPAEAPAPTGPAAFVSRTTTFTYSADQRFVASVQNAASQAESRGYDPRFGSLTSVQGPNQLTTSWTFDALGRKTLETRADGTKTRYDYVFCTNPSPGSIFNWPQAPSGASVASCPSVSGSSSALGTSAVWPIYFVQRTPLRADGVTANGSYTRMYFDTLGREVRVETQGFDGSGSSPTVFTEIEYDRVGNVVAKSMPYTSGVGSQSWTGYTWDSVGRVTQIYEGSAAGGPATTRMTYGGLTFSARDPRGLTTTYAKDVAGQLASTVDAKGGVLGRLYDPLGNLVQTKDPKGNVLSIVYDLRSRRVAMYDPDLGAWSYVYSAASDLVQQTNAKQQVAAMQYDVLGRLRKRTESDLTSSWFYDTNADGSACGKGTGRLCEATTDNGYDRKDVYDAVGRPMTTTIVVNSASYGSSVTYDASTGKVATQTFPTGVQTSTSYTPLGFPWKIVDARNGTALWTANSMDAAGHFLNYSYGNGIVTTNTYYGDGRISTTQTGPSNSIQSLSYGYDLDRNIALRLDVATGVSASYGYDELNRLSSESRSGGGLSSAQAMGWGYDAIGNMTTRTESGVTNTYNYNSSGSGSSLPHAVASVSGAVNGNYLPSYTYDANGNLSSGAARAVTWTSSDMVQSVSYGGKQVSFFYTPDRDRAKETYSLNNTLQRTTLYVGSSRAPFYQEDSGVAGVVRKHYVNAGGSTVAVIVCTATPCTNPVNSSTQYWSEDHLGSVTVVTNQSGAMVERMAYEPFGKRRYSNGSNDANGVLVPISTDYGYTEQEHIDEVGLINMNGRVYDPGLGRFLSSDPTVPHPESTQSYNRYAYVRNNPMGFVDPSGFDDEGFGGGGEDGNPEGSSSLASWGPQYGGTSFFASSGVGFSIFSGDLTFAFAGAAGDPVESTSTAADPTTPSSDGRPVQVLERVEITGKASMLQALGSRFTTWRHDEWMNLKNSLLWDFRHPGETFQNALAPFPGAGRIAAFGAVGKIAQATEAELAAAKIASAIAAKGPGAFMAVKESMSLRSAAYQLRVAGSDGTTAYVVNGVKFDGYIDGVLIEAKADYAQFLNATGEFKQFFVESDSGVSGMINQANRQLAVAGGTPIEWRFAEESVANAVRTVFQRAGITGINVVYVP